MAVFKCLRFAMQVLFSEDGYTYLDVRPTLELDEVGKVKGSVNIPLYNSVRKFNSETRQKVNSASLHYSALLIML